MCDYSLQHLTSKPARVGERIVVTCFSSSLTRGFTTVDEPEVAVCLLPGTELAFDGDVKCERDLLRLRPRQNMRQSVARFCQVNTDIEAAHHDALEFPDGKIAMVTELVNGQHATVLQLPARVCVVNNETSTAKAEAETPAVAS